MFRALSRSDFFCVTITIWLVSLSHDAAAGASSAEVKSDNDEIVITDSGEASTWHSIIDAEHSLDLGVSGPAVLALSFRAMLGAQKRLPFTGTVIVTRNQTFQRQWTYQGGRAQGTPVRPGRTEYFSRPKKFHIEVPPGDQSYRITIESKAVSSFAVVVSIPRRVSKKLLVKAEETVVSSGATEASSSGPKQESGPPTVAVESSTDEVAGGAVAAGDDAPEAGGTADPAATGDEESTTTPNTAAAVAPGLSETGAELTDGVPSDESVAAPAPGADSPATQEAPSSPGSLVGEAHREIQADLVQAKEIVESAKPVEVEPPPITVKASDGTVAGASRALANAIEEGFQRLNRKLAFHRIAVATFQELGSATSEQSLGKLVAELVAVELSKRKTFVVVERERLSGLMREHRLKDLGVLDESSVAEFGKLLGAQSLLMGTVAESGTQFVVTVRQVEVETGKVLVAGNVAIDRAGLIALSSEAIVTRSRAGAILRSALVPGWGQLYSREPQKGYLMLGTGVGLAVASAASGILGQLSENSYDDPSQTSREELRSLRGQANRRYRVSLYLTFGYLIVWGYSLVDAMLNAEEYEGIELAPSPGDASSAAAAAIAPGVPF